MASPVVLSDAQVFGQQQAPLSDADVFGASQPRVQPMSAGQVASGAATNFIPSTVNLAKNIAQPFMHPINTMHNIGRLLSGGAQELDDAIGLNGPTPAPKTPDEQTFDNLKTYFGNRYGSAENAKNSFAKDPAGVLADASIPLTLGGSSEIALPNALGKTAAIVGKTGEAINPIAAMLKGGSAAIRGIGSGAADVIGGVGTHTGGMPVQEAFAAGAAGGDRAAAFQSNLRGSVPIENVVSDARNAVNQLRANRGAEYRAGMGTVNSDPTVLDLDPVREAIAQSNSIKNFKGVDLSDSTAAIRGKINDKVSQWSALDPAEYHTAAGLDALKQSLGDIKDSTQFGTPERVVANNAYNAVRDQIVQQAPDYAKTMQAYGGASDTINDIQNTLSLKQGANVDTSVRKLQSALRDNVNTDYGRRADLAKILTQNGAPNLMSSIAGQALSPIPPRGLGNLSAGASIAAALFSHNPALLATLPFQSPRLVGEGAYYAGKASGLAGKLLPRRQLAGNAGLAANELGAQNNAPPNATALGQMLLGTR